MSEIVIARDLQRAVLLAPVVGNMAASLTTKIVDFAEMSLGSVQAKWTGNNSSEGEIVCEVGNIPSDEWFDEYGACATYILADDGISRGQKKNKIFNLGVLGFRYARIKYYKGANSQGTLEVIALGKRGG